MLDLMCADSNPLRDLSSPLEAAAQELINDSLSMATKKAYRTDWHVFVTFCDAQNVTSLPASPETLMAFLTHQAHHNKAIQTIRRRIAAIKFIHNLQGYEVALHDKRLSLLLKGIARQQKTRPIAKKHPIDARLLLEMIAQCNTQTLTGKRDKALMLFGFAGAFRRSELCALTLDDLEETQDGLKVHIRHSKGDQFGEGQMIAMPHGRKMGVITALKDYLDSAQIYHGPIFRSIKKGQKLISDTLSPLSVALIIKKYIQATGRNPVHYAAHSMRAGFLTEAAENGASLFKMLEVSRHKSADTLLGYIRQSNLFKDHAGQEFL